MPTANGKNRGYYKIEGAVDAFNFDFRGKVVLDIGSSTGGFTKLALDRGAKKVIAVEKGTNQMMKPLRFDPRIDLHEKTDIFDVCIRTELRGADEARGCKKNPQRANIRDNGSGIASEPLGRGRERSGSRVRVLLEHMPDVIMADVSFLSLKKVLSHVKNLKSADFLVMLKPQFEARPEQLNKGVVKNERIRRDIIKDFESWLKANNFLIIKKRDNVLKGKTGNLERFYWLRQVK